MYSGGSRLSIDIYFVDIELSYDVLSPLPIVLSKHFNHPHPYIEIATAISDMFSVEGVVTFDITEGRPSMFCKKRRPVQTERMVLTWVLPLILTFECCPSCASEDFKAGSRSRPRTSVSQV